MWAEKPRGDGRGRKAEESPWFVTIPVHFTLGQRPHHLGAFFVRVTLHASVLRYLQVQTLHSAYSIFLTDSHASKTPFSLDTIIG